MNRIQHFCVLAQHQSITKAAELLRISQPALSKSIRTLEDELNIKLITSVGRGIALTDQGKEFFRKAFPLVNAYEDLCQNPIEAVTNKTIRLASFEVFTTYVLGAMADSVFKDHHWEVRELIPGKMEAAIAEGICDYGITYLPIPHSEIEFSKIASVNMAIYGKQKSFEKIPFEELPFAVPISPVQGAPTRINGLDGWPDDKLRRKISYRVTLMESAMELCRRGIAVAYLPEVIVDLHNANVKDSCKLTKFPSPPALKGIGPQPIYLLRRQSEVESPQFKRLAQSLRAIFRK